MKKDIGLGIIGVAGGDDLLSVNGDFDSRLRVVALCDSNAPAARAMAERHQIPFVTTDPMDLLSQPGVDAVAVCGPLQERFGQCMAAIASGKRVLSGIPLAATLPEATTLAQESAANAGLLRAANPYRWNEEFTAVQRLAAGSDLGQLQLLESRQVLPLDAELAGADDLAVCVDLVRWVGGEITSVHARSNPGAVTAILEFQSGAVGRVVAVRAPRAVMSPRVSLSVFGTEGAALDGRVALERLAGLPAMTFALDAARKDMLGAIPEFEKSLDGPVPESLDPRDALRTAAVCAAIDESIQAGAPVSISPTAA